MAAELQDASARNRKAAELQTSNATMASILDAKVQSYIALYSGIISTLSPSLTTLQLLKTFDRSISAKELATISIRIFPHQCFLKWAQMNAATPVKEHANPWLAFGVVGVLQGGVYGQCTTYVSKLLGLAKKPPKLQDLLRGSAFAATGGARAVVSTHPGAAQEARPPTTAQEILRARVIARLGFVTRRLR